MTPTKNENCKTNPMSLDIDAMVDRLEEALQRPTFDTICWRPCDPLYPAIPGAGLVTPIMTSGRRQD